MGEPICPWLSACWRVIIAAMTVGGVPSQDSKRERAPMDPRTPSFVLCVCTVMLLVGTFSKNWASAGPGIGVGPTGLQACLGAVCRGVPWRGIPGDVQAFAVFALIAGIAAAATCAGFGVLYLANKHDKLPAVKVGNLALLGAAVIMAIFEIRLIADGHVSISWAAFPTIASAITGAVMLRKLAPHLQPAAVPRIAMPISPTLPTGPQLQAPPPSCPKCGTRLSFISDKQQWFCVRDQEYV